MADTGKIFCIMGKSGSGKDTVARNLMLDEDLNLKTVITYTTRPKRNNEIDGREYFFITEDVLNDLIKKGKVIEYRRYDTVCGIWSYATIDDGQIDLESNNYLIIGTLDVYKSLINYFGESNIVPIYIVCDDGERLKRLIERERNQQSPNYDEICRRFLADGVDFAPDKLNNSGINKEYNNADLTRCVKEIKEDILKHL